MKKFVLKPGRTKEGKRGYSLRSYAQDPAHQPVSRQDILDLKKALVWPPEEMRDINILEMQRYRDKLNDVWNDTSLDPTTKLLKAGYYSQMFSMANKKVFAKGEPGAKILPSTTNLAPPKPITTPPAPTPVVKKKVPKASEAEEEENAKEMGKVLQFLTENAPKKVKKKKRKSIISTRRQGLRA